MKIINKNGAEKVPLKNLKNGDCFMASDSIYMKLGIVNDASDTIPVAELGFGTFARFIAKYEVTPVDAVVVVEKGDNDNDPL